MRQSFFARVLAASAVMVLAAGVWAQPATAPTTVPVVGFIQVAKDGPYFINSATSKRFTPFGLNYTPHGVQTPRGDRTRTRLNWIKFDAAVTDTDCQRMADAGCNVLRVFLSAKSFVDPPGAISEESLAKTDALVAAAKKHGMRVIFGGPDWWEGPTELFPNGGFDQTGLYGAKQLDALEAMWKILAARYKDEPGVFGYSLRNEPMVPRRLPDEIWIDFLKRKYGTVDAVAKAWGQTLAKWEDCKRPADRDNDGDAALYDYQLAREFVAYTWARRQVDAIRTADTNHLVANGGIQWDIPLFRLFPSGPYGYDGFDPHLFADLYDYISVHWYDIKPDLMKTDELYQPLGDKYLPAFLTYCRIGNKPLVLEEFPDKVMKIDSYSKAFYAHVSGALIWEYMSVSTPTKMQSGVSPLFHAAKAKLDARMPVSLDGPDAVVWNIDKKHLLTWYADPATFRHNPDWIDRTGSADWHDTGGYWVQHFADLQAANPGKTIRIELKGEGPAFFDEMYNKKP